MNRLVALAVMVLFVAGLDDAFAQNAREPENTGELPPLIDRELFFGQPDITGAQLSPDGKYLAFIKPYNDVLNVWVMQVGKPFGSAEPITADQRPVAGYFWSRDSRYVLYVQDKAGDENYHVYAVHPSAARDDSTGVPPARDLTPLDGVRAAILARPKTSPNEMIVGLNDRDPRFHDVYRLNIDTGNRELLMENNASVAGWLADREGNVRLATRQVENGNTEILRVERGEVGEVVYTCSITETCGPLRFHSDGERVYMLTNKDQDLIRLVLFDPSTKESELVESDPEGRVDFGGALFSNATEELVATYYNDDGRRYYPQTESFADDLERLKREFGSGEIRFRSSTEDERLQMISIHSDVNPESAYLYDRETGDVTHLYDFNSELPSENLAQMQAVRYEARDGTMIPAYLTLPRGVEAKNLPVIIYPHGGPWSRDSWGYNPFSQFLANRGYAVLQPNFRGSTGYGKAWLNAGNGGWGTGVMQHDISDGVQYLIDEGIADPERIAIFGASYGGYATLAGLTFTPELYAAGISYVGISNLHSWLGSLPAYWGPLLGMFRERVGDPTDLSNCERLIEQSPLFSADQIADPLMVIQGANDPRVPQQESDQIIVAMRERGIDVQYLLAENEGHGFRDEENSLAVAAALEKFFAEHLGGRYQEDMPPEIAQRLEQLTVNPATIEAPASLEPPSCEAGEE